MQYSIKLNGLKELTQGLDGFSDRRFRASIATALTRTAKQGSESWSAQITKSVDRPTARTLKATTFTWARADGLMATVSLKDRMNGTSPDKYLGPSIFGGGRETKRFEQALINAGAMPRGYVTVPGRAADRDAYGNVTRSLIIAVISQLGSNYSPGYQRVISKSTSKRLERQRKHGKTYVVVQPGEKDKHNASPGIYEMQPDEKRVAIFLFKRSVHYMRTLDIMGEGSNGIEAILDKEVNTAIGQSIEAFNKKMRS